MQLQIITMDGTMNNITSEYIEQKTEEYLDKGRLITYLPDEKRERFNLVHSIVYTNPDPRIGKHKDTNPLLKDYKLVGRSDDAGFPYSVLDAILSNVH